MDNYLNPLINKFKENKNASVAEGQKKYLLNQFEFYGIKTPLLTELIKNHIKEFGKPASDKINSLN